MTWLFYKSKGVQTLTRVSNCSNGYRVLTERESTNCIPWRNFGDFIILQVLGSENILSSFFLSKFLWKCQILKRKWHTFEGLVWYFQVMRRQSSNDKIWSPRVVLEARGANLALKEVILSPDRLNNLSINLYILKTAVSWTPSPVATDDSKQDVLVIIWLCILGSSCFRLQVFIEQVASYSYCEDKMRQSIVCV